MADSSDYLAVNHSNWESRVGFHEQGYGLDTYRNDEFALSGVVQFDLPRLGNISGLTAVHLQCHIGTDTLSLSRLGASMTGLDFSASALHVAKRLADDCGQSIDYVEADVYSAVDVLGVGRFDLVYTGIGALCWLPSIGQWAQTVSSLLKPGGRLFIREGHPVLWSLCDPREDELVIIDFHYFEQPGGQLFSDPKTYVDHDDELASPTIVHFNHGLAEIITALMDNGMQLTAIEEHQTVPWNALGAAMEMVAGGEYQLRTRPERLAATYTLQAIKQG